ncbi:hypothetical protein [Emticicia sp. W12TSBA100-4]|uniref:hypothetical protein n=1 Tax=Emticicia sp. W12TSBA100-4 TaxID=3160965 RepID=UPI0033060961
MITYISAKDLVRVRSIGSQTAARRIQKVKKEKKLTNTNLVSLADYCEVLGENYIELLALINTNSIVEFVKLYRTLNSAV